MFYSRVVPSQRIAIVEDVPLFRQTLEAIVQEVGMDVVASAATAHQARTVIPKSAPDVVLLDLHLPDGHGFDVGVELRRALPHVKIVVLSEHVRPRVLSLLPAEEAVFWSYILKSNVQSPDDLVRVIKTPSPHVDPKVKSASATADHALTTLSERQREILRLVAAGLSNTAIAEALHIQPKSVEYHLTQIYANLGLKDDNTKNARVQATLRFSKYEQR